MEKEKFLYLMTRLALAFNEEIGEDRFKIYFEFLGNADFKSANEAINILIKENKRDQLELMLTKFFDAVHFS